MRSCTNLWTSPLTRPLSFVQQLVHRKVSSEGALKHAWLLQTIKYTINAHLHIKVQFCLSDLQIWCASKQERVSLPARTFEGMSHALDVVTCYRVSHGL